MVFFRGLRMYVHRTVAAGRGGAVAGIVSFFAHAASRDRLHVVQLQHSMTLSWLALTLSAVIILRLSGVVLPAELQGLATFPVEVLEHFFVVPRSDPPYVFCCFQIVGSGSGSSSLVWPLSPAA